MPIGTQFSSRLTKVAASYPNSQLLDLMAPASLYASKFTKTKSSKVESKLYVQGLPSTRFVSVDSLLWTYELELPVLIGTSGVREEELTFWQEWMRYWRDAKDSPGYMSGIPASIVVTQAGISCDLDSVTLNLQLVSNFDIPVTFDEQGNASSTWHSEFSYGEVLAYEAANSSHLMAEIRPFNDPNQLVPPTDWGWKDRYMISSISASFASEYEMVNASVNHSQAKLVPTIPGNTAFVVEHVPDMLVVKGIKMDGNLEIFGTREDPLVTSSQISGLFMLDSPTPDPLFGGDVTGGIQLWVANRDEVSNQPKPLILELPTGLMVGNSQITASAGDVIKVRKDFIALLTDI